MKERKNTIFEGFGYFGIVQTIEVAAIFFQMDIRRHCFFLGFVFLVLGFCYGQQHGRVLGADGNGVADVSVILGNTKISTSNARGIFFLPPRTKLPIKIRLSHPAYFIEQVEMENDGDQFYLTAVTEKEHLAEVRIAASQTNPALLLETPQLFPTEKIDAEDFKNFSPELLVPAINQAPGVYIQSGALNTNRITIRGVGARTPYGTNKIRAYFAGIPLTNGGGETTLDMLDPELLEAVNIIKGPKAAAYGNNLGGVILLRPRFAESGASSIQTRLTVGSFGMIKNSVSAAVANKKLATIFHYDHLQTQGFRENNKYNRSAAFLLSRYTMDAKNTLAVLVDYIDYFAQIPSSLSKTDFMEDPTQAAFTWKTAKGYEDNRKLLSAVRYVHRFSENMTYSGSVYYKYLDHYEPRPFNILDEFTNGYGAQSRFNLQLPFFRKSELDLGGEVYFDRYRWRVLENRYEENNGQGSLEGNMIGDNLERRRNLNFFAEWKIAFTEKFQGELGINLNSSQYRFSDYFNPEDDTDKSGRRDFDPILAPTLTLRYSFSENYDFFLNVGRGYNFPSLEETLTPEGLINPGLGPEKGMNYELGQEVFLFQRKLYLKANAYLMRINDLLVAERVGEDQYIGRNAGKTEHKGIEVQVAYRQHIFEKLVVSPYFNAEITDHRFIDFVDGENDYSGNRLTGVPQHKVSGGLHIAIGNLRMNGNFLHLGKMPLNDENSLFYSGYTVLNTQASFSQKLSKKLSVEMHLGIDNIADRKYASSVLINAKGFGNSEPRYYYPGKPRNWYGGINLKWNF